MKIVLKRVMIAAVLVVVCVLILAATKAYGVWVIHRDRDCPFRPGYPQEEKPPGKTGEIRNEWGKPVPTGENP